MLELAAKFARIMNANCIDVSTQTYKASCPPAALMKLPLVASEKAMDYLVAKAREAIETLSV